MNFRRLSMNEKEWIRHYLLDLDPIQELQEINDVIMLTNIQKK